MSSGTDLVRCRFARLYDFAVGAGVGAASIGCVVTLLLVSARHNVASNVFRYVGF